MSAGGNYGAIGGSFSQNKASSSASAQAVCDKKVQEGTSDERQKVVIKNVSPTLAQSYVVCIKTCNNKDFKFDIKRNESGLTISIQRDVNEAIVRSLTLRPLDTAAGVDESQGVSCFLEHEGTRRDAFVFAGPLSTTTTPPPAPPTPMAPITLTLGNPVKVECVTPSLRR